MHFNERAYEIIKGIHATESRYFRYIPVKMSYAKSEELSKWTSNHEFYFISTFFLRSQMLNSFEVMMTVDCGYAPLQ